MEVLPWQALTKRACAITNSLGPLYMHNATCSQHIVRRT
jgi:hypothetical protein